MYLPVPDRWNLPLPEWERYGTRGDYPYVGSHWWDPYNQNRLKGDYPVLGKRTFFMYERGREARLRSLLPETARPTFKVLDERNNKFSLAQADL